VRWATMTEGLAPADSTTAQQISAAWAAADNGQVVTLLVDSSKSMEEPGGDGKSRMEWLKAALSGQVTRSLSGSIGLWEFSRQVDGELPYRELVPTGPVVEQKQALLDGVAGLKPLSATQLYTSLLALYEKTQDDFKTGKRNSIVVLTDGPNDGGLSFEELRAQLDKVKRADRPIPISVIAIGSAPERDPLTRITQSTGGTFAVADDGKAIDAALAQILSAG
jgi:hypothetical protein